jgi:hypothetical protein
VKTGSFLVMESVRRTASVPSSRSTSSHLSWDDEEVVATIYEARDSYAALSRERRSVVGPGLSKGLRPYCCEPVFRGREFPALILLRPRIMSQDHTLVAWRGYY